MHSKSTEASLSAPFRFRFSNSLVGLFAVLLPLCGPRAVAQTTPIKTTRNLVFTDQAVYLPGTRVQLSTAEAWIHPDPRGRYALIECVDTIPLAPFAYANVLNPEGVRLLLYDAVTGHVKTVWRQDAADQAGWQGFIMEVFWLPQTDTALAVVADRSIYRQGDPPSDETPDQSLLLIRAPQGADGVRRILQGRNSMIVSVSPRRPYAVVQESTWNKTELTKEWFSINEHGSLGPALSLGPHASEEFDWNDDGTTTYFRDSLPIDSAPSPNPASTSDAAIGQKVKTRRQWYAFNVQTQALTPIDTRPKNAAKPDPPADGPVRLVRDAVVTVPPGSAGAEPPVKAEKITPLWLVRADNKREGFLPTAALIAPDAQKSFLLADNSAVLYAADGAAYAVPLTRQPRPDFDAQYRKFLKKATLENAHQIALALIGCAQDDDNKFPPSDSYATALAPYVINNNIFNNPASGQPGFTYLLNSDSMATMASPGTTAMGYLSGPGGRAVLYADGHAVWEDAPTPPSSP